MGAGENAPSDNGAWLARFRDNAQEGLMALRTLRQTLIADGKIVRLEGAEGLVYKMSSFTP